MASTTARGYRAGQNAARSPNVRHGFAESNPKVRIELQKTKIQLQKELVRLEKQSKAETNNIATHQQALKMNFRKLEQKRNQLESPPRDRTGRRDKDEGARRGIFYSQIPMAVDATAAIYSGDSKTTLDVPRRRSLTSDKDDVLSFSTSAPHLDLHFPVPEAQSAAGNNFLNLRVKDSPYVTSPFNLRRATRSDHVPLVSLSSPHVARSRGRTPYPLTKRATFSSMDTPKEAEPKKKAVSIDESAADFSKLESKVQNISMDSMSGLRPSSTVKRSALKLPPLESAGTKSEVLVAHANTIDKETLLRAANMMKTTGGSSHGPIAFQQFYSANSDSQQSKTELGSRILLSPVGGEERSLGLAAADIEVEKEEEEEEEEVEYGKDGGDLKQMFEQIKNCRYIRHYTPVHNDDN